MGVIKEWRYANRLGSSINVPCSQGRCLWCHLLTGAATVEGGERKEGRDWIMVVEGRMEGALWRRWQIGNFHSEFYSSRPITL